MNRFPDFQIDLLFTDIPPLHAKVVAEDAVTEAPAKTEADHTAATTKQPVPLAPQNTGVLPPISGLQTLILTLFGVLSFVMLVAMTRYGKNNHYGD